MTVEWVLNIYDPRLINSLEDYEEAQRFLLRSIDGLSEEAIEEIVQGYSESSYQSYLRFVEPFRRGELVIGEPKEVEGETLTLERQKAMNVVGLYRTA